MKHVALITINFNSETETHACLHSLTKLYLPDIKLTIYVIDNASKIPYRLTTDEKESGIILIRSEENLGFTGGNNLGMQRALQDGAEYIMLLNNDTVVDEHLVINLLSPLGKNKKIGATVPKIYFAKGYEFHKEKYEREEFGKVLWFAGGEVDWKNVFTKHIGVDEVDKGQYDTEKTVEFATGCCVMIKREVLKKVGLFNNNYFLYFEDGDLSERIKRFGYSIMYVPRAHLWHINAGSSGSGSSLHDYYLTRNRMLFGMKFAPVRSKIALLRESFRLLTTGREWQKIGIRDFYLGKFGKGSYK